MSRATTFALVFLCGGMSALLLIAAVSEAFPRSEFCPTAEIIRVPRAT